MLVFLRDTYLEFIIVNTVELGYNVMKGTE
jgi:hypothetical protein